MPNNRLIVKTLLTMLAIFLTISAFQITTHAQDITPPVTTATLDPTDPDGDNDWYVTPVEITLSAADLESGVRSINYRVDGGSWQSTIYSDTLNLAPNPSFEVFDGASSTGLEDWEATTIDGDTVYSQETITSLTGFESSSAKIVTTGSGWHGINHSQSFAVTSYLSNMIASAWIKTENVTENSYFKIFAITDDGFGGYIYTQIGTSSMISGTNDWSELSLEFVTSVEDAIGVYLDIGLEGSGTIWVDAVTLNESLSSVTKVVTLGSDGEHDFEFYSVDRSDNTEVYSCSAPKVNCLSIKIDQTPPGNWHNSGAIRAITGADHELYVYTTVDDPTSGLSLDTNKYQYHTEKDEGFGHYEDIIGCSTAWLLDEWVTLASYPSEEGVNSANLQTPKTDFCNNDWKICKIVRFYAKDMAGNESEKDFCINGPWIQFRGEGIARSNTDIDMLSEPEDDNTDGLIELGGSTTDFFTSTQGWVVRNSEIPTTYTYDDYLSMVNPQPTETTDLLSASGVYLVNSDFTLDNAATPNDYNDATFNQIYFINGDLLISNDIVIADASTALFIVNGNVEISKSSDLLKVSIFADGWINTAYDVAEGQFTGTLELFGMYSADKFIFSRTLQGTNNADFPSEDFVYEPKYLLELSEYLGTSSVRWISIE